MTSLTEEWIIVTHVSRVLQWYDVTFIHICLSVCLFVSRCRLLHVYINDLNSDTNNCRSFKPDNVDVLMMSHERSAFEFVRSRSRDQDNQTHLSSAAFVCVCV